MDFRYAPLLVAFAALALAGPAAAHDDSHAAHGAHAHSAPTFEAGEPAGRAAKARRIEVVAREADGRMSFEPASIHVKKGESVEFVVRNEGQLEHEFVLGSVRENAAHAAEMQAMPDMRHNDPNAVRIAAGHSAHLAWRFTRAGDFEFACLIPGHYEAGMKGDAKVD